MSDRSELFDFNFCIGTAGESSEYTYDDLKEIKEIVKYSIQPHFFSGHYYHLKHKVMSGTRNGWEKMLFALNNGNELDSIYFDRSRLPEEIYRQR